MKTWLLDMWDLNYMSLSLSLMVLKAMLSLRDKFQCKTEQILSNNIMTVWHINMQGGLSQELMVFTAVILQLVHHLHQILLWLPGVQWQLFHMSIGCGVHTAWTVSRSPHPQCKNHFKLMPKSLFAMYSSLFMGPHSSRVNAWAQTDWGKNRNYVNAPFMLISSMHQLGGHYHAEATTITPWWPAQK